MVDDLVNKTIDVAVAVVESIQTMMIIMKRRRKAEASEDVVDNELAAEVTTMTMIILKRRRKAVASEDVVDNELAAKATIMTMILMKRRRKVEASEDVVDNELAAEVTTMTMIIQKTIKVLQVSQVVNLVIKEDREDKAETIAMTEMVVEEAIELAVMEDQDVELVEGTVEMMITLTIAETRVVEEKVRRDRGDREEMGGTMTANRETRELVVESAKMVDRVNHPAAKEAKPEESTTAKSAQRVAAEAKATTQVMMAVTETKTGVEADGGTEAEQTSTYESVIATVNTMTKTYSLVEAI